MAKLLSLALALCLSLSAQIGPAPSTAAAQPRDYALLFSGDTVSPEAGRIPFIIRNSTGQDAQVLLIPHLERRDEDGGWEEVPFLERVGFCGTPDPLPAGDMDWSVEPFELWGALEDGVYRLSYEVTAADGTKAAAQGEFFFHAELQICGYPLAEN